jgi:hypothetical protein
MEHLENARLGPAHAKPAARSHAAVDELGGLIAHIGEGGEAVVDQAAVREADFQGAPVFDHRGRQRARIVADEPEVVKPAHPAKPEAKKETQPAHTPTIVREAIADVEARTGRTALVEGGSGRSKIAISADRGELTPAQRAKLEKWLKHTMAANDIEKEKRHARPSAASKETREAPAIAAHEEAREAKEEAKETRKAEEPVEAAPKRPAHRKEQAAPAFEITNGSTEVDEELSASDEEIAPQKKTRSARDILNEIRLQKKAEDEGRSHVEVAKAARRAKEEADAIESHIREGTRAARVVAMSAHESPEEERESVAKPIDEPGAPRRRHRSGDLEPVVRPTEPRGADLELTLAPVRDEDVPARDNGHVSITEIGESPTHASLEDDSPLGEAGIPMVGRSESRVSISEAVKAAVDSASEEKLEVSPSDAVLAGPSTDDIRVDPSEGIITAGEADRIKKRLEENWNRL